MAHYCQRILALFITTMFLLSGCSATPEPFIAGQETMPPMGWVDYCKRNVDDKDCSRKE